MANRRYRQQKEVILGPIKPTKKDLENIEKIILKRLEFGDYYIEIEAKWGGRFYSGYQTFVFDNAKDIKEMPKRFKRIEVRTKRPNLYVRFERVRTVIKNRRVFSRGNELRSVDEIFYELDKYLKPLSNKLNDAFARTLFKPRYKKVNIN